MAWTAEDRRKYAPTIQEIMRQGMIARLAQTIEAIDPQPGIGRQRVWSSLIMLQALGHLARDSCAWRRLPRAFRAPRSGAGWTAGASSRCSSARWRSWSPAIAWRAVANGDPRQGSSTRRA